jgi:hypothetical protein
VNHDPAPAAQSIKLRLGRQGASSTRPVAASTGLVEPIPAVRGQPCTQWPSRGRRAGFFHRLFETVEGRLAAFAGLGRNEGDAACSSALQVESAPRNLRPAQINTDQKGLAGREIFILPLVA